MDDARKDNSLGSSAQPNPAAAAAPFLSRLTALLGERGTQTLYPCIVDLIENGLDRGRFSAGEYPPNRQDVTQYLAAWSRHVGLSEEESRGWLLEFCMTKLAVISSRTPAAIAHSTKSNLRYIYKSAVPFACKFEQNPFRARCSKECPFYPQMLARLQAEALEALKPKPVLAPPPIVVVLPVKVRFQEQLQTAMQLARAERAQGTKLGRIVELLNERGLKTRTGRTWTCSNLVAEFHRWDNAPHPAPDTQSPVPAAPQAGLAAPGDVAAIPGTAAGTDRSEESPARGT